MTNKSNLFEFKIQAIFYFSHFLCFVVYVMYSVRTCLNLKCPLIFHLLCSVFCSLCSVTKVPPSLADGDLGGGSLENSQNSATSSLQSKAEAIHSTSSLQGNPQNSRGNSQSKNIDYHEPKGSRNDKISKLEQEINTLVYSLYDLNESKIKLI